MTRNDRALSTWHYSSPKTETKSPEPFFFIMLGHPVYMCVCVYLCDKYNVLLLLKFRLSVKTYNIIYIIFYIIFCHLSLANSFKIKQSTYNIKGRSFGVSFRYFGNSDITQRK